MFETFNASNLFFFFFWEAWGVQWVTVQSGRCSLLGNSSEAAAAVAKWKPTLRRWENNCLQEWDSQLPPPLLWKNIVWGGNAEETQRNITGRHLVCELCAPSARLFVPILKGLVQPKLSFHPIFFSALWQWRLWWHFPIHVNVLDVHGGKGFHTVQQCTKTKTQNKTTKKKTACLYGVQNTWQSSLSLKQRS